MPNWSLALFQQALEAMNLIAVNLSLGSWAYRSGRACPSLATCFDKLSVNGLGWSDTETVGRVAKRAVAPTEPRGARADQCHRGTGFARPPVASPPGGTAPKATQGGFKIFPKAANTATALQAPSPAARGRCGCASRPPRPGPRPRTWPGSDRGGCP